MLHKWSKYRHTLMNWHFVCLKPATRLVGMTVATSIVQALLASFSGPVDGLLHKRVRSGPLQKQKTLLHEHAAYVYEIWLQLHLGYNGYVSNGRNGILVTTTR